MEYSGMLQHNLQQLGAFVLPSNFTNLSDWGTPAPTTSAGQVLSHAEIDALIGALTAFKDQIPDEEIARYNLNLHYSSVARFESRFKSRAQKPKHPYPDMVVAGYEDWWVGPKRTDFCEELIEGAIAHLKAHEKPHDRIQAIQHVNNLVKFNDWTALELRFEKGSEVVAAKTPQTQKVKTQKPVDPINCLTYEEAKQQGRSEEWFNWKRDNWLQKYMKNPDLFLKNDPSIPVSLEARQDFALWAMNHDLLRVAS
jgi:hypothetical protein